MLSRFHLPASRAGYPVGSAGSPWWLAALRALAGWIRRRDELARQRRALARLDDRLLRDVGLTREQRERAWTCRSDAARRFWPL